MSSKPPPSAGVVARGFRRRGSPLPGFAELSEFEQREHVRAAIDRFKESVAFSDKNPNSKIAQPDSS